ncbi:MAG TPA: glycosyltransferase family 4 protein [Verrucomicrobiae bacterium]|nr:glycosyltransferase family 4 protein [Verrucomicrobiae bacterium]
MRIVFVLPFAGLSGGIKVVAIYADRLQKRGHEVHVVSVPRRRMPLIKKAKSFLKGQGWPKVQKDQSFFDNPDVDCRVLDVARAVVDSDVPDADVVVATWWKTAEWVAALSAKKGRKFYLVQDHETFPYMPVERVRATYRMQLRKIVVSNWLAEIMGQDYMCTDLSVVPNAVDGAQFDAPPRVKNEDPTVGFLFSGSPRKRSEIAVEALEQARRVLPNLKAIAFGATQPADGQTLPDWVGFHLQPSQSLIPEIYARCDAWLFTSSSEGFGLPILEAMACRTPVIATRAGAAPDLIDDQNGFLVDGTGEAFAEKIVEIAHMSNSKWRAMSDAALASAGGYDWDDATVLFEKALLAD